MPRAWYGLTNNLPFDSMWAKLWVPEGFAAARLAMDRQGGYWLLLSLFVIKPEHIGPFESFEAAAACFETIKGNL